MGIFSLVKWAALTISGGNVTFFFFHDSDWGKPPVRLLLEL